MRSSSLSNETRKRISEVQTVRDDLTTQLLTTQRHTSIQTVSKPAVVAFYLPQFLPIAENDRFWGKGHTEWDFLKKWRPLYKGHSIGLPATEIGYYDPRAEEVRDRQASQASRAGLEGFLMWHYWFEGRLVLGELPKLLKLKAQPNFPFAFAWANESWTGKWLGMGSQVNIHQDYGGVADVDSHFEYLRTFFVLENYIKILGRPLLYIYKPECIPSLEMVIERLQMKAVSAGLGGLHVVLQQNREFSKAVHSLAENGLVQSFAPAVYRPRSRRSLNKVLHQSHPGFGIADEIYAYDDVAEAILGDTRVPKRLTTPIILPNWDTSPRLGAGARIYENTSPEKYERTLGEAVARASPQAGGSGLVIVKSWNEWSEGNYLEPDQRWGTDWLTATAAAITKQGAGQ